MNSHHAHLHLNARRLALILLALALMVVATDALAQAAPAARAGTVELPSFVSLVKQQGPTVVNISSTHTVTQAELEQESTGDPLADFFRRFMGPQGEEGFEQQSLGSGFIIDPNGYILTNAHVVVDADEVTVRLMTKREYKAKVVGIDPVTDVALLKIDANGLPTVRAGDPEKLEPGEWVAAIGAPFGFENSVTAGIVSAKGRLLPNESYVPFIQTDVAVNPGNSGGPLFTTRGEVIGINSIIYSRTGGFMGISFAIPINIAMDVAKELRATGKVTRGRIGVQVQELTVELAKSFGLNEPQGALVAGVEKGGPAAKAGVLPGDVILAINGEKVKESADLARLIAGAKPGSTIALEVWRKGARVPVKVTVDELKVSQTGNKQEKATPNAAGLVLGELTDEQRQQLGVQSGLLVRAAQGAAARAGIRAGDVIQNLNNQPVGDVANFEKKLAQNAGKTVALLVNRGGQTLFIPLKLPPAGGPR